MGSAAPAELQALLTAYNNQPTAYTGAIADARKRSMDQQAELEDAIRRAYEKKSEGPSKSELYFKLAQSFLSPTKSGRFTESLGNAAGVGAEYKKEVSQARREDAKNKLAGEVKLRELQLGTSKEDLNTLRALDLAGRQDRRLVQGKLLEQYIQSGKAQSDVGREAVDAGYAVGSPEYSAFVKKRIQEKMQTGQLYKDAMLSIAQGNLALRQQQGERMSPQELSQLFDAKSSLGAAESSSSLLNNALKLADKAFAKSTPEVIQYEYLKRTNPNDERVQSTELLEQQLTESALAGLKAAFGGNPTEGERAIALLTKGLQATSRESRKAQIKAAMDMIEAQRKRNAQNIEDIRTGKFRTYSPEGQ